MANLERPPELSDPRFKDWIYQLWKKVTAPVTATTAATGVLTVPSGGTGAVSLTGYVKGNGTNPLTGVAQIPYTDLSGVPNNRVYGPNIDALDNTVTTGIYSITGIGASAVRTMTGTANRLTVTNGDGVSGNPTFDISTAYVGQATITTLGTITTGVWNAGAVTSTALNGPLGETTPNTVAGTSVTASSYFAVGMSSLGNALDLSSNANTAGYAQIAWFQVTNNAGGTNCSRFIFGQVSTNALFIEAADKSNVKGIIYLQPYGGTVQTGGAATIGGALTVNGAITNTSTISCTAGTGTATPVLIGTISVNTTAVGNIGVGTDDLMTYSLPANSLSANGKGVRVTAWGTLANNANAKTLTVNFGSVVLATDAMTINGALNWYIDALIFRTALGAQRYVAKIQSSANGSSVRDFDIESGTAAETDTAAITIKCTGAATADNDIVQNGMFIEFIN